MRFVDVRNDIAFHKIFGDSNRTQALMSFINAILGKEGEDKIDFIEILNPYKLPAVRSGKSIIIDIKARDKNLVEYIVEMQVADVDAFDKRVLYYTARNFDDQITRGGSYKDLNPIIFIGILDFNYTSSPKYLSTHKILEVETHENYLSNMEYHFVELQKFNKTALELLSLVDKWIYFIKNAKNLEIYPTDLEDVGLQNAYLDANMFNWTQEESAAYFDLILREQDLQNAEEKALRKATEKGLEEGIEKGTEVGIKMVNSKVAKKAIQKGYDNETIANLTGLTIDEIEKLR